MFESYIKFDNIEGSYGLGQGAKHHQGWSHITSFDYDLSATTSTFSIKKPTDAATPILYKFYLQNIAHNIENAKTTKGDRNIRTITIDICRSAGDRGIDRFFTYIFTGCRIDKVNLVFAENNEQRDEIDISYRTMQLKYSYPKRVDDTATVDARKGKADKIFQWDFRNNIEKT